jgi:hypothetical protein
MKPSDNIPNEHKWSVHWGANDFEHGWKPNEYDLKLLRHLGDNDILFTTCRWTGVNFGKRIEGAKGPIPFHPPYDEDGNWITYGSDMDDGDSLAIANAQNWSIMKAYKMGYEAAKKEMEV